MRRLGLKSCLLAVASLPAVALAQTADAPRVYGLSPQTSTPPVWPQVVRPARGAPNILLIMTDDVGFGASSTFGGPIPTPTFDALAREGLRIAILDRLDGAKTLAQVRAAGSDGAWFACDITDPAQVQRAVKEAGEQFGNLPVLVHCAGIYRCE